MKLWQLTALIALLSIVAVVKSESSIEVGDDGHEYEVKRFNVQGRQLGEERSQCVVTRRRRAAHAVGPATAANKDTANPEEDFATTHTTPATGVDTQTSEDGENVQKKGNAQTNQDDDPMKNLEYDDEAAEEPLSLDQVIDQGMRRKPGAHHQLDDYTDNLTTDQNVDNGDDETDGDYDEDSEDYDGGDGGDDGDDGDGAIHGGNKPAPSGGSTVAGNGLVVVHGNTNVPPNVNSQTHAVFQLVNGPTDEDGVPQQVHLPNGVGVYVGDADNLHYEEEISPVSTTAIWSTGDDDHDHHHHHHNHADEPIDEPAKPARPSKPTKRPGMKPGKRPSKKPANNNKNRRRKNKNKNKNKNPNNKVKKQNKRKNNRNKTKLTKVPKNKRRPARPAGNKTPPAGAPLKKPRRRHSNKNKSQPAKAGVHRRRPGRPYDAPRRRETFNTLRKKSTANSNRRLNANLADTNKRDAHKQDRLNKDKGTRTFTKTETMTQTGSANDQPGVNCIYIRKDAAPTTARPFWGLLGREVAGGGDEGGASGRSAQFGMRKRANMRFHSPK